VAVWVIRGGSARGLHEDEFIDSSSIGVYFGVDGDARQSDDVLRHEIQEHCILWNNERELDMDPSALKGVVSRFLNQVRLFRDGVKKGDTVLMPRKSSKGRMIRRGLVESGYEYWGDEIYRHRRQVRWENTDLPRAAVPYTWTRTNQQTVIKVG